MTGSRVMLARAAGAKAAVPQPVDGTMGDFDADEPLGRMGSLEVRLARTAEEVDAAQALRYRVFYEEMSAVADQRTLARRRDSDGFDAVCDHLVVLDREAPRSDPDPSGSAGGQSEIVATYRLLPKDAAESSDGLYTAGKFDLQPLFRCHQDMRFLEVGRSCVLEPYRRRRTVELLWHGIWAYCRRNRIDVMLGCASLQGTDPDQHAMALSFLHHNARGEGEWAATPVAGQGVRMDRLPAEQVDRRAAMSALPPLLKGYLRLGAKIGDGAVVDPQFGTTVVLVVLPIAGISARYMRHFGIDAEQRRAAG